MSLPETCLAAVFDGPNTPLRFQEFPLPQSMPDGAVLCRIRISTICGSDLHTTLGRRVEPSPSILGHESVGTVVAAGRGARCADGTPVQPGDRVSWTIMSACGDCFFCARRLPQKCTRLFKYGHSRVDIWPGLTGGYAEYIYLFPGTGIFRVPDAIGDAVAATANCALATAVCAADAVGGVSPGEHVLILGAGLLGIYLAALAKDAGAASVLVADLDGRRAEASRAFGADATLAHRGEPGEMVEWARGCCPEPGVDVAFEACGDPRAAQAALGALRTGGRLLVAGLVTPDSTFPLDGNQLTRKCLSIRGIHNYRPDHLGAGLDFLARTASAYPYAGLVSPPVPLRDIHHAFELAKGGTHARVAVRCGPG